MTPLGAERFDELVRPFAVAIFALSEARKPPSVRLSPYQDARVREAVSVVVRKACDVVVPAARPPEVSVIAAAKAHDLGIELSLETWHSQPKFDPGRLLFHYEHKQPIGRIVEKVSQAIDADEVMEVLRQDLRIVWITKDEDRRLTELGFRSKRPDPDAAYVEAGIELRGVLDPPMASAPNNAAVHGGTANEPGFMPIAGGETFETVQLGLCLDGVVKVFPSEGAPSTWSAGGDTTLFNAQCRGVLARSPLVAGMVFREAALFNPSTGTLLLQNRFPSHSPADGNQQHVSLEASAVQLVPAEVPPKTDDEHLQEVLTRAVTTAFGDRGQLRVEMAGWDAPGKPYCSVELGTLEDGTSAIYFETSPPPSGTRWWTKNLREINSDTVAMAHRADDFTTEQVALLVWDALRWGISPWDLALSYARPPTVPA